MAAVLDGKPPRDSAAAGKEKPPAERREKPRTLAGGKTAHTAVDSFVGKTPGRDLLRLDAEKQVRGPRVGTRSAHRRPARLACGRTGTLAAPPENL